MGNAPNRRNPFKIIGLCLIAAALVAAGFIGARVMNLAVEAREIANTTPTPEPRMDNVLVVTVDPALPTPEPLIKTGMKGELVKRLQQRLKDLGYYSGDVDGQFGPGTKTAVVWFQSQHGLDADGIAGPSTQDALFSQEAQKAVATFSPKPTEEPSPVPTQDPAMPQIVSKAYPVDESYAPKNLVSMNDTCDPAVVKIKNENTQGVKEAVDALQRMLRAAQQDGLASWQVSAGYRSYKYQQELMDQQVSYYLSSGKISREKALEAALEHVAPPGASEHHTGLAFDITVPNTDSFAGTDQCAWLKEHCWEYGFILRYTKEKQEITGFDPEPWHVRYVGVEHSIPMRDRNLCLEEYALQGRR